MLINAVSCGLFSWTAVIMALWRLHTVAASHWWQEHISSDLVPSSSIKDLMNMAKSTLTSGGDLIRLFQEYTKNNTSISPISVLICESRTTKRYRGNTSCIISYYQRCWDFWARTEFTESDPEGNARWNHSNMFGWFRHLHGKPLLFTRNLACH